MMKITLKIDGMACGMCEAHINDAIRKTFSVKKVTSSYRKKETVIIVDDIEDSRLTDVIENTGYKLVSVQKEPYEKKGLFAKQKNFS